MTGKRNSDMVESIVEQLKKGEVSYTSLPRKLKREYYVIVYSDFNDVIQGAPKGYWKIQNFVKAVLKNLDRESQIGFKKENYEKFVKTVKKYNAPDSKIMNFVMISFSTNHHSNVLLELL